MSIIAIRHGLSEANNHENYGTPAFDNPDSPLMPAGREQAIKLGGRLVDMLGIQLINEPVAVSMMRRSKETAELAGFQQLTAYPELNEEKGGLSDIEIIEALETKQPPEATRNAARHLIQSPPPERIWITHALLIAALCQELGVHQDKRFTPKFCEARELPI